MAVPLSDPDAFDAVVRRRRADAWNLALVIAMWVVCVGPYLLWGLGARSVVAVFVVLTGTAMVAALAVRRTYPMVMLLVITAAGVANMALVPYPSLPILAIPLASYSFARWVDGRASRLVLIVGAIAALLGPGAWTRYVVGTYSDFATMVVFYVLAVVVCGGLVVTPYAVGRRIREAALMREARVRRQAERYQALLVEREQQSRVAEARARAQIARELHDVVAHSLSVMIVQAEGGKALATKKPEQAAEVLDTIAETGRDALGEMRRIVGVLRGGPDEPADYAPNPTLADIPEMVRRAGERIELRVDGPVPDVPPSLGLTVYRITQEAVTNVLKHAGPTAHARVLLQYSPTVIVVEVRDDGAGAAVRGDGRGNGLRGMHERVASMGGILRAEPQPEGGFLVQAQLPVPQRGPGRQTGGQPAVQARAVPAAQPHMW